MGGGGGDTPLSGESSVQGGENFSLGGGGGGTPSVLPTPLCIKHWLVVRSL